MPRILFMASHRPGRSPSQRFRFEQYLDHLKQNGFEVDFSWIINEQDDKILYSKGNFFKKLGLLLRTWKKRRQDKKNYRNYDIIFVQREAWMLGSTVFERKIKSSGARFVFDFDDSIWLMDTSDGNKKWEWLKNPGKTAQNIAFADMVFAGNSYLAGYALKHNRNVKIVPTTIDTDEYIPSAVPKTGGDKIVLGWSGSITTIKHFEYAVDFLKVIRKKYGDKIEITVIGDGNFVHDELKIKGKAWKKEDELKELRNFDIGIMPLPDDEWAKGKCGLKGLQYMALGIPTIMSPVGVNTEIIQNGENGMLASTTEEWISCLEQLIENAELRKKIGKQARKTVVEKYSVLSQRDNYVKYFNEVLKK